MTPFTSKERIAELIKIMEINQTEFCKRTGILKSALSNYLNGDRVPRQDQLKKIADAFDIDVGWLMGYDVPMKKKSIGKFDKHNINRPIFTEEEKVLIYHYRKVDAETKTFVKHLLKYTSEQENGLSIPTLDPELCGPKEIPHLEEKYQPHNRAARLRKKPSEKLIKRRKEKI